MDSLGIFLPLHLMHHRFPMDIPVTPPNASGIPYGYSCHSAECIRDSLWIFLQLHRMHQLPHKDILTLQFRPMDIFKSAPDLQVDAREYFFCFARCKGHGLKNILAPPPNTKQLYPTNIPMVGCISAGCINLPENIPPALRCPCSI
jgi:hypothetical protein